MLRPAAGALVLMAAAVQGCARPAPPLPEGGRMEYYRVPWPDAFPGDVAVDDEGRLWFTDRLTHAIGVFDLDRESFQRIETPTPRSAPYGIIRGPAGSLWFGESNGRRLGVVDPAAGVIHEFEIPELAGGPRLLVWSAGRIWFTAQRDDAYGWFDPETGESRVWRGVLEEPYAIAAAGGAVWVAPRSGWFRRSGTTHEAGALLYRVDGGQTSISELPSLEVGAAVRRMAADPAGRLWMTQFNAGRLAAVEPGSGALEAVETLEQPSRPYGVSVDAWGRVWYAEQGNEAIVLYDPETGDRRRVELPLSGGTVRSIAVDPRRRRAWLPLSDLGVIAVLRF